MSNTPVSITDNFDDGLLAEVDDVGNLVFTTDIDVYELVFDPTDHENEITLLRDFLTTWLGEDTIADGQLVRASSLSANDALIRIAALHGLEVDFTYSKDDNSPLETRRFVPESAKVFPDHTTFTGSDKDREALRSFRTDRIKGTVRVIG